jgi:RND family efflux transporter MFP subunit
LFVEYDSLASGKTVHFLVHLTELQNWTPIQEGRVFIKCGNAVSEDGVLKQPGIFNVRFSLPTDYDKSNPLEIHLEGAHTDIHIRLTDNKKDSEEHSIHDHHGEEEPIPFLLEQQWTVEFGMKPVLKRPIHSTFEAFGSLQPKIDGNAFVYAPTSGRILIENPPMMGSMVEAGQTLAWFLPSLSEQGDIASFDQRLVQARLTLQGATAKRERLESLVSDGVAAQNTLLDAQLTEEKAKMALKSAEKRSQQAQGVLGSIEGKRSAIPLKAPIEGILAMVNIKPGQMVDAGTSLFQVIDSDPIWLELEVPEIHIPLLDVVKGVSFVVDGFEKNFEVDKPPIAIGGVVDPHTRTLPIVFEVPNPDGKLKPGMFASGDIIESITSEGFVVPQESIVYNGAVPVVFVGLDGERFEQRTVRLGGKEGLYRYVVSGLSVGEWVVYKGAYGIRLASMGENTRLGHGHAH